MQAFTQGTTCVTDDECLTLCHWARQAQARRLCLAPGPRWVRARHGAGGRRAPGPADRRQRGVRMKRRTDPQPPLPNYVRKLAYLHRIGAIPREVGLHLVTIYHDDWCAVYAAPPAAL